MMLIPLHVLFWVIFLGCVKGIFNKFNPPIVEYQYYENLIVKMDAMWKSTGGKQGTGEGNGD